MYPTKSLHDDDNGAITPAMWTSVVGTEHVELCFRGMWLNVSITATQSRFCWFMGFVPHKTCRKEGSPDDVFRVCHSAYSKPAFEHLSLSVLRKEQMKATMDSVFERDSSKSLAALKP